MWTKQFFFKILKSTNTLSFTTSQARVKEEKEDKRETPTMPVTGQYTWSEKSDVLVVKIPLKGVSPKTVDIFCTENILKVNYAPFLIDILLHGTIDPNHHRASVKDGVLDIKLYKQIRGVWGQIESELVGKDDTAEETVRECMCECMH